jgi:hypothetical protein
MRWFGYLWTVAVNCFYLFVILYVFDKLDRRPEVIPVAVLGLLYVTIRSIAIGQALSSIELFAQINKQLLYVRKLLNDPHYEENQRSWIEAEQKTSPQIIKVYISSFFLLLISLVCMLVIFSHL